MKKKEESMPETWFRASQCCRVLGNPSAYRILKSLAENPATPGQLAEELGLSVSNISKTLTHMHEVHLVRYQSQGLYRVYRIKNAHCLKALREMESFVDIMRKAKA